MKSWDTRRVTDADQILTEFLDQIRTSTPRAFRGHADSSWKLEPSIDRLDSLPDEKAFIGREQDIVQEFRERARHFFEPLEFKYLGEVTDPVTTHAIALLQHYGAPTRLLDWTGSPFVALYFAVVEHPDRDGVVWSFSKSELYARADSDWEVHKIPREKLRLGETGKGSVNLNAHTFKVGAADWFGPNDFDLPFLRLSRQHGFFTIAGRLGVDHGDKILSMVQTTPVRWEIPHNIKQELVTRLKLMGLDSTSLGYMGADIVGRDIAAEHKSAPRKAKLGASA